MIALDGGTIVVALIVSIFAPMVVWFLSSLTKKQDWARQDAVAAAAKEAAADIVRANHESTEAVTGLRAQVTDVGNTVNVTHALVNSDKTAGMKRERDGSKILLVMMRELLSSKEAAGQPVSDESREAVLTLQTEIATLDSNIADRVHQQELAEQRNAVDAAQVALDVHLAERDELPPTPIHVDHGTVTVTPQVLSPPQP